MTTVSCYKRPTRTLGIVFLWGEPGTSTSAVSSVPSDFKKNMIQVINTRDLFIEQLTTDKKFREGRLGVFLSFKNWKCKLIP